MTDPADHSPDTPTGGAPPPQAVPQDIDHSPVQRVTHSRAPDPAKIEDAELRREFFSDAMREVLAPLAGILERRINPLLAALEALPDDVERFTQNPISLPVIGNVLDQPSEAQSYLPPPAETAPPVRFLRPPGAAAPGEFETLCSRCGKCAEVCPASAIRLDSYAFMADGAPAIVPTTQPCVVCDSLACMHNCPSGALKVVEKLKINMGTAKVNLDLCPREDGEDCRLCVEACPITDEVAPQAAIFIHAETGRIRVRKNACIGCGLCEARCPTNPPAIVVEPYRLPVDPIIA